MARPQGSRPYRGPRIRATKSPQQYPYTQYPYQNVGTQLTWRDSAPFQTRGGDAASLGLGGTLELPVPGGPEVIPEDSGYSGFGASAIEYQQARRGRHSIMPAASSHRQSQAAAHSHPHPVSGYVRTSMGDCGCGCKGAGTCKPLGALTEGQRTAAMVVGTATSTGISYLIGKAIAGKKGAIIGGGAALAFGLFQMWKNK